ncbi:MAG: two-component regulator propeller domain-containing protein [Phycisphaerales bacterium]
MPHDRQLVRVAIALCALGFGACTDAPQSKPAAVPASPAAAPQSPPQSAPLGSPAAALGTNIWVCYQARNGDRWFGSDGEGVYRFDGTTLRRYLAADGLPDNHVRELQEDASGAIFIGTLGGVCKFDGRAIVALAPVEHDEVGGGGWRLEPGDLWFKGDSNSDGPLRWDGATLHRLHFPRTERGDEHLRVNGVRPWSPYGVYTIYRDRRGSLWFGTLALGLCRYDGRGFEWMYERELSETPEGGSFGIRSIMEDRDGRFWICNTAQRFVIEDGAGAGAGAVKYRAERGVPMAEAGAGKTPIYFNSIARDARGDLWLCTYGDGVWRFDGTSLRRYVVRPGAKDVLGVSVSADQRGEIWLATQDAGVFRFDGERFRAYDAASR